MRKIINNKSYDTEKAARIGSYNHGEYVTDFGYYCETLYRKRTGEYFLHGEGGPASKYAESLGNGSWQGGEKIEPMTYEAATAWAIDHLDTEDYQAEFGEVEEDDTSIVLTVRVPQSAKDALDRACSKTGQTRGEILARLIGSLDC